MKRLDFYWYSQNPVAWLLLPVSWLFWLIVKLRRFLYENKLLSSSRIDKPVVIIGNITVGGSGKTPLLIALCQLLKEQGFKPGVISRGYGSETESGGLFQVSKDDSAQRVGDEPLLISQRTACPVVVSRDRPAAARYLLQHNDCDIVLSDDGLQHYRLQRDYEIAVIDARRGFGNGYCIPAGPLRESKSRLDSINLLVTHYAADTVDENESVGFKLEFGVAVNIASGETRIIDELRSTSIHAVAGIGDPQRFFNQLRSYGIELIEHPFPDHYQYQAADLFFEETAIIIMTEKDAVKCATLGLDNVWAVPVTAKLSESLKSRFIADVKRLN